MRKNYKIIEIIISAYFLYILNDFLRDFTLSVRKFQRKELLIKFLKQLFAEYNNTFNLNMFYY